MKSKIHLILFFIFSGLFVGYSQTVDAMLETQIKNGDIIFIKTNKANSFLPNGNSKFNYAGVIFLESDVPMVYYATEPLKKCNLEEFKKLSIGGEFMIKRLIEQEVLTEEVILRMSGWANAKLGIHYDNKINLNNDKIKNLEVNHDANLEKINDANWVDVWFVGCFNSRFGKRTVSYTLQSGNSL